MAVLEIVESRLAPNTSDSLYSFCINPSESGIIRVSHRALTRKCF